VDDSKQCWHHRCTIHEVTADKCSCSSQTAVVYCKNIFQFCTLVAVFCEECAG